MFSMMRARNIQIYSSANQIASSARESYIYKFDSSKKKKNFNGMNTNVFTIAI